MIEPFQTTFQVPMTCDGCVQDVSGSIQKLPGITKVEARLQDQLVLVEGTAAPSSIVAAIQGTGRDAILRGSGGTNSAAVCILETHNTSVPEKIRGLARMIQVSKSQTLVDLTINGLSPGKYWATVREAGDISRGAESTGGIWEAVKNKILGPDQQPQPRGVFGVVNVNDAGKGNVLIDQPVAIWELIGRSMVVSKNKEGPFKAEDADTIVGVIARSAGVWDNDKMVCSCSGKNVWEERKEQVQKGML
ncbi:superoxide dismutase copper chaperone Lys7, putative [Talaromyces stipitatus ATCC 10500]|uniref:Superoxide dismutase 1 copper chaperone n=1 Tax=Talaromyces stipitatus (strain ATCC 10500 / CBS 375.48 / QM 6759 / NRRL 1006) TaxID=441959 RepID=B8MC86_TALSN|nr:superoxide dismutase copper chaperone Lys7, putative [Talaromyces stipitatus ATCC 10500]EED18532.1 superoxide dismutase copper chaperone Lys7, putative [Talaromyces stipitatus ATCC 10500]